MLQDILAWMILKTLKTLGPLHGLEALRTE